MMETAGLVFARLKSKSQRASFFIECLLVSVTGPLLVDDSLNPLNFTPILQIFDLRDRQASKELIFLTSNSPHRSLFVNFSSRRRLGHRQVWRSASQFPTLAQSKCPSLRCAPRCLG